MSRPRNILQSVDDYRQRLAAREARTAAEFTAAFEGIAAELQSLIDDLAARIEQAREAGTAVSPAWGFQQDRFQQLLRQTEALIAEYAPTATARITADQRWATELAGQQAQQLTLFQLPPQVAVSFTRLPQSALQDLIGALADGSPLADILDDLGPSASQRMQDELIRGLATGRNPREIARRLSDVPNLTAQRARLISRTETLRAYRSSSIRNYAANSDVVRGWRWVAALDERTCLACVAMHGREFPASVPFGSHPACRCSPAPLTRWSQPVERGVEWFERQPEATKLSMAGPSKYRALRAAEISLDDLVAYRNDPKFGPTRYEKSLMRARAEVLPGLQQAADD